MVRDFPSVVFTSVSLCVQTAPDINDSTCFWWSKCFLFFPNQSNILVVSEFSFKISSIFFGGIQCKLFPIIDIETDNMIVS